MMRVSSWFVVAAIWHCPAAGYAQPAGGDAASRRDQLAKTLEMVSDPDPLQRMANLESIVASHDALRIEVAIKAAMASDDAQLRGMAMTAYMASVKTIEFQIRMPADVQRQYDAANGDETELRALTNHHGYVEDLQSAAFQLFLNITNFQMNENQGKAVINRGDEQKFSIAGDRYLEDVVLWGHECIIAFRPTRSITLAGTLACNRYPPFDISAQMF